MQVSAIKWKANSQWQSMVLDAATLLFVGGIISTVGASIGSSSTFTLSLIIAGMAVQAIRRISSRVITIPLIVADLITLAFVTAIVSNPRIWGIPMIVLTLCSWICVQALRYFVGKPTTPISAGVDIAITAFSFFLMVSNPDYPDGYKIALVALIIWVVAEMAWVVVERKHFATMQ